MPDVGSCEDKGERGGNGNAGNLGVVNSVGHLFWVSSNFWCFGIRWHYKEHDCKETGSGEWGSKREAEGFLRKQRCHLFCKRNLCKGKEGRTFLYQRLSLHYYVFREHIDDIADLVVKESANEKQRTITVKNTYIPVFTEDRKCAVCCCLQKFCHLWKCWKAWESLIWNGYHYHCLVFIQCNPCSWYIKNNEKNTGPWYEGIAVLISTKWKQNRTKQRKNMLQIRFKMQWIQTEEYLFLGWCNQQQKS